MKDWLGTTKIELDKLGRPTKITDYEGKVVSYELNDLGQREKIIYPNNLEVNYEYENLFLKKVTHGPKQSETTTYNYDRSGRVKEKTTGELVTKYEFNPLGTLQSLTHTNEGKVLEKFNYSYDPVGNMISQDRNGKTTSYKYDSLNRLIQAGENEYSYDNFGNRIKSLVNGIETRYNYNEQNQLIKTQGEEITNYEYDLRGNLIKENQSKYFYDATNMIAKAITPKGEATYTYNGFRNRVKRNNQTYTLDITKPYNSLLMLDNQNFIWGNGLISTTDAKNKQYPFYEPQSYSYMHDHLGSPIRLLNHKEQTHSMVTDVEKLFNGDIFSYDEFGQSQGDSYFANPFGFTGYMQDDISDMFFAQAREYNPEIGRFTAEDLIKGSIYAPFTMNQYGFE
jgi:RHS repeat-associated protein